MVLLLQKILFKTFFTFLQYFLIDVLEETLQLYHQTLKHHHVQDKMVQINDQKDFSGGAYHSIVPVKSNSNPWITQVIIKAMKNYL